MKKFFFCICSIMVVLNLSGCDKTLPPASNGGGGNTKTNAFNVSINSANNSSTILTVTNSVNSIANISNISDTISAGLQARLTMQSGQSTCTSVGTLTPGSSCTYVFTSANAGAPGATASGTITVTPTFASGNAPAAAVFPSTITSLLYVGTPGGIYSYNGSAWTVLNAGLANVTSLAIDGSGNLYAGNNTGVAKYNGTSWNILSGANAPTIVTSLLFDSAGNLYAGSNKSSGAVTKYSGGAWTVVTGGTNPQNVNALAVDSSNNIYAGCNITPDGILKYNGSTWSILVGGSNVGNVLSLAVDANNFVYAGNNTSIYQFTTFWAAYGSSTPNLSINALTIFSNFNLYAGSTGNTSGTGAVSYVLTSGGSPTWTAVGTGAPADVVSLSLDSVGNVYAGTRTGTVYEGDGATWTSLGAGSGAPNSGVQAIAYGNHLSVTS